MTMQNNIDIAGRIFRRNMDQLECQTLALEIDDLRPVFGPIAVATDNNERWSDRFELEGDRRLANVAQMPDLIRIPRKVENSLRQLVIDRKSTRLNSSHVSTSYAVFCLKKKKCVVMTHE